ncbi:MAG: hypothetical protein JXB10_08105 [Pirellulales bacterium]|nr:hypothetical protein [Pirellulales bacterium]
MNRFLWLLGSLSFLYFVESSDAVERCQGSLGRELQCTRSAAVPCCCPDAYCRKPMPCVTCIKIPCSCNCYCPKPAPCVSCCKIPSSCNCYCPKPMPRFCWPVLGQFYRCPPCGCPLKDSPPTAALSCERGRR